MEKLLKYNNLLKKDNFLKGEYIEGIEPVLTVTADDGAVVTATNGSITLTNTTVSGQCSFSLSNSGIWSISATLNGQSAGTKTINVEDTKEVSLLIISSILNDNTWDTISQVSSLNQAANYWSIGDCKEITLNGTVGHCTFSNYTTYAFIIGINHNSSLEGNNRIHFQIGKTSLTNGTDITFIDEYYGTNGDEILSSSYFTMNTSRTNANGWVSSQMRVNICGVNLTNYTNTFIGIIPSELKNVLKPVTKYTDNTGNHSTTAENVTATTDYIFLLSEYEVMGSISYANSNESDKQQQYAYYVNNSKIKYSHSNTSVADIWWLRSPNSNATTTFVSTSSNGAPIYWYATRSLGFSPCFCV